MNAAGKFAGTKSPRHLRVIHALVPSKAKLTREQVDRVAGVSNGPDLITALRRKGLAIPCPLESVIDRDGRTVQRGVYSLTTDDRRKLTEWLRLSSAKGEA